MSNARWFKVCVCLSAVLRMVQAASADPFHAPGKTHVLIFVRSDCPITNRYAPELQRIAREFASQPVDFWLIYPDRAETEKTIAAHVADYKLPGSAVQDPDHRLVKRAEAKISPQAAVFDAKGRLLYSGRIDDRFVAFGKSRPEPETHDLENAITATLAGKPVRVARTHAVGCYLADLQ